MSSKAGIVILSYNSRQDLPDCLSSVAKAVSAEHEIIVVDNNSDDGSAEYVKKAWPAITLIQAQANTGYAGGNNLGIQRAMARGCDYVFILNPDTVAAPKFLGAALAVAQADDKVAIVQSKLLHFKDQTKINSVGNAIHYLGFGYTVGNGQTDDGNLAMQEVTYASGAAILIQTKILKRLRLFDETLFMYHEDLALGWLVRLAGYKIMLAPNSIVYHKYQFSKSITKYYYMERNRFIVLFEYYHWLTLFLLAPAFTVMELGLFAFSFASGFWRQKLKAYRYMLTPAHWPLIAKRRKQIQGLRVVSDRAVTRRFTGVIAGQEIQSPLLTYLVNPVFALYWWVIKQFIIW